MSVLELNKEWLGEWALQRGFKLLDCKSSNRVTLPPFEKQIQSKWVFMWCSAEANYTKAEVKQII